MSRYVQQSNTGGVDGVFALLSLVKDPEKYNAKMQEILEAEARLEEKIALAGVADQILFIREQVGQKLIEAEQAIEEAKIKAEVIVNKANQTADVTAKALKHQEETTRIQCQKAVEDAQDEAQRIIAAAKKQSDECKVELTAKRAAVKKQHAELQDKIEMHAEKVKAFEIQVQAFDNSVVEYNSRCDALDRECAQFKVRREAFEVIIRNASADLNDFNAGR